MWKVAQIKMVLKPGKSSDDPKSYRPISLLPIPSKLMESLFLSRLSPIVESKHIIPNHQFGFRKAHGTIEQVHRVVKTIHNAFENGEYCTAAFLDISQAFDRVWHDGLLTKLRKLLPINYFLFLKSYLQERSFFVRHGEEVTTLHQINAGVPQGSKLGPILYLLFTFDLPLPQNQYVNVGTFADDTVALSVDKSPLAASHKLQGYLNTISNWLQNWRIKANETKSVQVTYTTRRETCPPVRLNSVNLPQADVAKYLGIHLDRRLTWKTHIFTKRKALGLKLRNLHWLLNQNSKLAMGNKLLLYKSVLKPIWSYGIQLWGTASNSNLEILQRFQSKVIRMITKAPWYVTNNQLHRDLKLPTIKDEIKSITASYKHRILIHPNHLVSGLMNQQRTFSRLKRRAPQDLI